jgi:hypothetical protein
MKSVPLGEPNEICGLGGPLWFTAKPGFPLSQPVDTKGLQRADFQVMQAEVWSITPT